MSPGRRRHGDRDSDRRRAAAALVPGQPAARSPSMAHSMHPCALTSSPLLLPVLGASGLARSAAIRFLYALADYELAQHDDWLIQQGLDPLVDPSARAQYRQHCFRQALLASATPLPRPPSCVFWPHHLPPLPSRDFLARNRPGPADPVFSFPPHFSPYSLIASCSHPLSPAGSVSAHPSPIPSLS